ncbi:MAG: SusC/RagA family protein, partial [Tannerellaceae bacterium]|nr:SusC/RagA family protein [Tannerellaceae bacterium]
YYNYNYESLFIPGLSDQTIVPFFTDYGNAENTAAKGVAETLNWYYNLNGQFKKTFNQVHKLNALAGMQVFMSKNEYDAGEGYNTANDFYQTLGSTGSIGRHFYGYLEKWNWMNFYAHADYTYNDLVAASVNLAVDGASSTGTNANTFQAYPSAGLTWIGKGWLPLSNSTWINRLNVRAEYGLTGNSRFSSNYGKFSYTSNPFQSISGIVRANISNTYLKPERNAQLNVGMDVSLWYNRIDLSVDYYNNQASNVIINRPLTAMFGTAPYYDNTAKIENQGIEFSAQISAVRARDFEWIVGGNIASNKNKLKSLAGGMTELVTQIDGDVQLVSRVGESLYQFYGYQSNGVFSSASEAEQADLVNRYGRQIQAGDVLFIYFYGDHRFVDNDRVALGSASPKYFGGFYTHLQYRSFGLTAEFTYTKGNKAYNAVRRYLESGSTVGNQSRNMVNRWNLEGQRTEVPRVQWGDPLGNSDFSSRWIEDASYLRMKNITLSYRFDKKVLNFIRSGTLYVSAENLWTETKYLDLDPEFSYSTADALQGIDYAKVMQPKTIKFGLNLYF